MIFSLGKEKNCHFTAMDEKRRLYQSKLSDTLKYNERMIDTLMKSIESVRSTMSAGKDLSFYENRIEQTEESIRMYKAKNAELEKKLLVVHTGGCDEEIVRAQNKVDEENQKQIEEAKKKEAVEKLAEEKRKQQGNEFFQREKEEDRREHFGVKTYERFREICDTAPDYILQNIKTMPNNKGYKFRGVVFFGELPEERNAPLVIFEKKPQGMYITETYNDHEVTYFKPKDGQKKLVKKYLLQKRKNGPAIRTLVV